MKFSAFVVMMFFMQCSAQVQAGVLSNGEWTVSACGEKPEAPAVKAGDAEAYNQSIGVINHWQELANTYYECLVNEANKDTAVIVNKAKQEQLNYKQSAEAINAALEAAAKKLNGGR